MNSFINDFKIIPYNSDKIILRGFLTEIIFLSISFLGEEVSSQSSVELFENCSH